MKCPKCGYISFDYNQLCPKCNKNISDVQERFNLPSFRPEPPSLLGFLTGEANESNVNLHTPSGSRMDKMPTEEIGLNDSVVLNQGGMDIDEKDLDISFEPQEPEPEEDIFDQEPQSEPEKRLSDADFHLEGKGGEKPVIPSETAEEDALSLDLGDLALEESEEIFDKLEVPGPSQPLSDEGISLESLDSLPADIIEGGLDELESEIELDLDDLKVSDMGNLEVGPETAPSAMEMESTLVESEAGTLEPEVELTDEEGEKLPDISDLILEEAESGTKEQTMILDDLSAVDSGVSEKNGAMELGEISLDDFNLGEEELLEDLKNLNLKEEQSGDKERTILLDDLDMKDSVELEKSFDISDISLDDEIETKTASGLKAPLSDEGELELDLDAMSLDVDEYQKKKDSGDDDFVLDLDDMDIDLDLNKPKKNS